MTRDALIGYTGFVGATLLRSREFAATFNSGNIESIRGEVYKTVICAGVTAVKWKANKDPEADRGRIQRLMESLTEVKTDRFVLISTIDVYLDSIGKSERDEPQRDGLHAYGLNRLHLEDFVRNQFSNYAIIRLPALFGPGLKKNALFDLLNNQLTDVIVPNAEFQWYPVHRLAGDIDTIVAHGVDLINITSEPIAMATVRDRFFPSVAIGQPVKSPSRYDARSIYYSLLGGRDGYHFLGREILREMLHFIGSYDKPK